ncbi:DUF6491 family protein [Brevundimonas sp.]|uniref:DUF6491 family protein n=1 Tax=Brevundimonas sp. TaxID=1871086 RepID=UPI00289D7D8D|nr:DUF6491 family protein [Brevundimonas sp.]
MRLALIAAVAGASTLASCAPSTKVVGTPAASREAHADRCFNVSDVRNFTVDSHSDIYVRSGRDKVFQVSAVGGCWDLDSAVSLAILPRFPTSSISTCVGDTVEVIVPSGSPGNRRCRALVVKSLTPEEVAALPKRSQP